MALSRCFGFSYGIFVSYSINRSFQERFDHNRRSFASIYAILLAGTYKYARLDDHQINDPYETGDIDLSALWCILSAGWFAVVPFLSWSSTLRRLQTRRPIFTYWTFLIAIGGICAGVKLGGANTYKIYWATAAAVCTSKSDHLQDPAELYLSSWSAWTSNNCTSQCGSLGPTLFLRTGSQMVPMTQTELPNISLPTISARESLGSLTGYASPVVFIQWMYACWSGRRTPSEARDRICIKLYKRSSYQQMGSKLAVSIAMCVYIFACASLTICPFLLVFNIVFNEMNLLYLPQDEPLTAVGQWSQCVITIILVIAAIINKYHDSWLRKAKTSWRISVETLFTHRKRRPSDSNDLERSEDQKFPSVQSTVQELAPPKPLSPCEPLFPRKTISKRFTHPLHEAWFHARKEWSDFQRWIRNPIEVSRSNTALRKVMAAQAEPDGLFQAPSLEQTGPVLPVSKKDLQIKVTNLFSRQRSRSL